MTNSWISLSPYVYVEIKSHALLYDTHRNQSLFIDNPQAISLLESLLLPSNVGTVHVQNINSLNSQIHEAIRLKMILVSDTPDIRSLPPIFALNKDFERLSETTFDTTLLTANILEYLLELHINISQKIINLCTVHTTSIKRQRATDIVEMDGKMLSLLFSKISESSVRQVKIYCCDLHAYSYFPLLKSLIAKSDKKITITTELQHYISDPIIDSCHIEFILDYRRTTTSPKVIKHIREIIQNLQNKLSLMSFLFIVYDEETLNLTEEIISDCGIESSCSITPIYTEDNTPFLKRHVFNTYNDIFSRPKTFRELFRNKKINSNFFGIFQISPAGDIFSAISTKHLGNIGTDSLSNAIFSELSIINSWRLTRSKIEPCSNCLLECFCPPISSIEILMKQYCTLTNGPLL